MQQQRHDLLMRARTITLTGVLLLLAPSAAANHGSVTITLSNYTTNAYPDMAITAQFGADLPATAISIGLSSGWTIGSMSPAPSQGEQVGSGTWTAKWLPLCTQGNRNFTVTYKSSSELTVTMAGSLDRSMSYGSGGFNVPPPDLVCSSTTDLLLTLVLNGRTADGDPFLRNPATAGNYSATLAYTDTNSVFHTTTSNTITITT